MTQDIPQQVIDARLSIDTGTGGRYVELVERVAVPAGADTEIVELSAIGRLVQSAAGRYGAALAEVIAPLRAAILALPDGDGPDRDEQGRRWVERQLGMWRHAAMCLLDHITTGNPIDFQQQPVPDAVMMRLEAWRHGPNSLAEAAGPAHEYTGPPVSDAVTEVIPRLRVFRNWKHVPVDVLALAHAGRGTTNLWYVRDGLGGQWRRIGPDGDDTLHEIAQMFILGDMIAVDVQTGQPC